MQAIAMCGDELTNFLASNLRREGDGLYYLVTPGEKWRIRVDVQPLVVTDIEWSSVAELPPQLSATLNTGKTVTLDATHPLYLEPKMDNIPAIRLPHGLAALFSRSAWYRLVEMSEQIDGTTCVVSAGEVFPLEAN
jgi:hypothetical protein